MPHKVQLLLLSNTPLQHSGATGARWAASHQAYTHWCREWRRLKGMLDPDDERCAPQEADAEVADQVALGSPHRPAGSQAVGAHQPAEAAICNKRGGKADSHKRARSAGLRWQACTLDSLP